MNAMNDQLELFKEAAVKGVMDSGDYRLLMVDGKAVLAEKFSSSPVQTQAQASSDNKWVIFAIALLSAGFVLGALWGGSASQSKIQNLQAENLILQSKIQKIKDLID